MRSEFQIDGASGSLFVVSKTLAHGYPNLERYEKLIGVSGIDLRADCGRMVVYPFDDADSRCALYLAEIPLVTGEVAAATAVAYDPDTPDEMLNEFVDATGIEYTDDVPFDFLDAYDDAVRFVLTRKVEGLEGRI